MELYLLSIEEIKKLPDEILMCKAPANFSGWKSDDGYCDWWLRSPGDYDIYAACVFGENGDVYHAEYCVIEEFAVRPALRLKSDISSLKRDNEGNVIYGKLPDGTDIRWIDISEYLGEPTLLMKECLPETRRYDKESNNYETSEIKGYLDEFERKIFADELGCCKNAPYGYEILSNF